MIFHLGLDPNNGLWWSDSVCSLKTFRVSTALTGIVAVLGVRHLVPALTDTLLAELGNASHVDTKAPVCKGLRIALQRAGMLAPT